MRVARITKLFVACWFVSTAMGSTLEWKPCPNTPGYHCSNASVPMDHDHPEDGRTVTLSLVKLPCTSANKTGTMFFNFGGPGGPGTKVLPSLSGVVPMFKILNTAFDLVSWDPRGVGESAPVTCGFDTSAKLVAFARNLGVKDPNATSRMVVGDTYPMTNDEIKDFWLMSEAVGKRCGKHHGDLLDFVDTRSTAMDLDLLRDAVGDQLMNYYGVSYGTILGAVYANIFPQKVGSMALDGNAEPSKYFFRKGMPSMPQRVSSDTAIIEVFDEWLHRCGTTNTSLKGDRCLFSGGSYDQTRRKWNQLLEAVRRRGYINQNDTIPYAGVFPKAYDEPALLKLLMGSLTSGYLSSIKTTIPYVLKVLWEARNDDPQPRILDGEIEVATMKQKLSFYAIMCSEAWDSEASKRWADWKASIRGAKSVVAGAGPFEAANVWSNGDGSALCSFWPGRAKKVYRGPWNKPTNNRTILVLGNRFDPSTPLVNSVVMANDVLHAARGITCDWVGHGTFPAMIEAPQNSCLTSYITGYFFNATLPPFDASCKSFPWWTSSIGSAGYN